MLFLKHHSTDVGFCRVVYQSSKGRLYCVQDEGNENFVFYNCSSDEEPMSPLNPAIFSMERHEPGIDGVEKFLEDSGCFLFTDMLATMKKTQEWLTGYACDYDIDLGSNEDTLFKKIDQIITKADEALK